MNFVHVYVLICYWKYAESYGGRGRDGTNTWPLFSGRLDKWSRTLREKVKRQYVQQNSVLENCIYRKTVGQMNEPGSAVAVLLWLGEAFYFSFAMHFLWASHVLFPLVCDCGLLLLHAASTKLSHSPDIFVSFCWG